MSLKVFREGSATGQKDSENPTWEYINVCLKRIDSNDNAFCILSNDKGAYVQCAGSIRELCVEFRQSDNKLFKHYVIGKKKEVISHSNIVWFQIQSKVGLISVHSNEILDINDAILIFKSFYLSDSVPEIYNKRNITRFFKEWNL